MLDSTRARSALYRLDPNCPRDEWVKLGMASKAAGLSFSDFNDWSAQASNYGGERDTAAMWKSIKANGSITAGTLYAAAWPNRGYSLNIETRRSRPRSEPTIAASHTSKSFGAEAVWNACLPAPTDHPYIRRKKGTAEGLRQYPETGRLRIAEQAMAGNLVVPCFDAQGRLQTLQFISREGKKFNLPGARYEDGFFVIGELGTATKKAYLVEGIGQAWAVGRTKDVPAIVSFGSGRMATVAQAVRARYVDLHIVVLPDRGKEADAEKVARTVSGAWCELPQDMPNNYDVNDYALEFGDQALAALLGEEHRPVQRYRLLSGDEIFQRPPVGELVRGVLPAIGLASIYGESRAGKSFFSLGLGISIAEGTPWFGLKVQQAPVVYVPLEGEAGISARIQAWKQHEARHLPARFHIVLDSFFLLADGDDVGDLASAVPQGAVIILDTLSRAAPNADENSSRDMGGILEAAKRLQQLTGGLVILVHHTGKDSSRGMRGHSSLFAALDAAIEIKRHKQYRSWSVAKSKDGPDGQEYRFDLRQVLIGEDDDGHPRTSCVVVEDCASAKTALPAPRGDNQRSVLEAVEEYLTKGGEVPQGAPHGRRAVKYDQAMQIAADVLSDRGRPRERAKEALGGLIEKGVLCHEGVWIWKPEIPNMPVSVPNHSFSAAYPNPPL